VRGMLLNIIAALLLNWLIGPYSAKKILDRKCEYENI